MSGMNSPITVLTAPYNVINNSQVRSLDTQFLPNNIKEINQTPNYDLISNPNKPKEGIENFASDLQSRIPSISEVASKIPSISEVVSKIPSISEVASKISPKIETESESESNLVTDSLVDTALYDYLNSKDDYYDNKNEMVDNTVPYNPLKQLVKNYLDENISMYDNRGKYFDQYLFNKQFDEYIDAKNKERLLKEKVRLYDLNKIENIEVQPYQLPLNKILINTKDTWFNMYDDLKNSKNPFKNLNFNSYFYIGVTLIIITILFTLLSYIFN